MVTQLPDNVQTDTEVVEKEKLKISVRSLVEFVFRSGDIDNRVGKGAQAEAMQEGSRIHRKIQKSMGKGYRAEVPLKHEVIMGHYLLSVEGRADGIFSRPISEITDILYNDEKKDIIQSDSSMPMQITAGEDSEKKTSHNTSGATVPIDYTDEDTQIVFIDEIKGMYTDVTRFEAPIAVHLAQAKCYAAIITAKTGLAKLGVQLTYCDMDTQSIKRFEEIYSCEELARWFDELIESYRKWTDNQYEWNLIRRDSIKMTEFPFPYREGQRELAADVYRTMVRRKKLFLMAPTGTGKTMATVFPAVKAIGEGEASRIFYLTAKTVTRTVAKEAFDILKSNGLKARIMTITAKEKICPLDEMDCNPVHCPYAKGHYDRVNDAVYELMTTATDYTREVLLAQAERHQVCPFEMSLDLALWSDAIICDYNYLYDPNACLQRFFGEGERGDYIFLIDEAHNLVERGRNMYSAALAKEDFLKFKKIFRKYNQKIASAMDRCNKQLLEWKRECHSYTILTNIDLFYTSLLHLMNLMDEFMRHRAEFPERKEVTEFYFKLRHFVAMTDFMGENHVAYTDFDEDGRFIIHQYCVNPAVNLQPLTDRGKSAIFFSATLLPVNYYKNFLSTEKDNYAVYAHSIFPQENRLIFVASDVSSLYTRRNLNEYQKISAYIRLTAGARQGNYIVFFPSYQYMENVYQVFEDENGGAVECLVQSSGMKEPEREEFMRQFDEPRGHSLVAFCVLGGIFSEGIDLTEDRLVGALVVGTGLPQICNEREILKSCCNGEIAMGGQVGDNTSENGSREGFACAYQYPGMNKVLQAAGRVIRTATDRGVIGLLDERFLRRDYQALFPREWADYKICSLGNVENMLKAFWER